ncbi:MAG: F0F1 ATP synthase subunit epsilon [Holosporaceae bacterium]|jgi:F-type H+-transporting ATPase subunit epsilon|nr:F0F1 ATP synthase subunit epsilon [Holosporaceae bacterium]
MNAKVLELEKKLFDGEVSKIVLPATEGEMCILQNHASIITSLKKGSIKIFRTTSARPLTIAVFGGICSFHKNSAVFILEQRNPCLND